MLAFSNYKEICLFYVIFRYKNRLFPLTAVNNIVSMIQKLYHLSKKIAIKTAQSIDKYVFL